MMLTSGKVLVIQQGSAHMGQSINAPDKCFTALNPRQGSMAPQLYAPSSYKKEGNKMIYIAIGAQGRGEGRSGELAIDLEEEGGAGNA
jgi:hypothetical protein